MFPIQTNNTRLIINLSHSMRSFSHFPSLTNAQVKELVSTDLARAMKKQGKSVFQAGQCRSALQANSAIGSESRATMGTPQREKVIDPA
jgi:hypothetical protein